MDEAYTKLTNPKYVKFRDGHKEKYNPSRHIGGKGKDFDRSKCKIEDDNEVKLPPKGRAGQKVFKSGSWWDWNEEKKCWEKE